MAYYLIIFAFAATVVSLIAEMLDGGKKIFAMVVAGLVAIGVLVTSLYVQREDDARTENMTQSLADAQSERSGLSKQSVELLEELGAANDRVDRLSQELSQAQAERNNLSEQSSTLLLRLEAAKDRIEALSQELTQARSEIEAFDTEEARRFSMSQCKITFQPIHEWESVRHAMANGRRFNLNGYNVGSRKGIYEDRLTHRATMGRPQHQYAVLASLNRGEEIHFDGASPWSIDPTAMESRIAEIYSDISALGCNMRFRDGDGFVCECN